MTTEKLPLNPARHTRLHERVLLNPVVGHVAGLLLILLGSQVFTFGKVTFEYDPNVLNSQVALLLIYLAYALLSRKLIRFPGGRSIPYSLTISLTLMGISLLAILALRFGYSRSTLLSGFVLIIVAQTANFLISRHSRNLKFAWVPYGDPVPPFSDTNVAIRALEAPNLEKTRYDGIIVDVDQDLTNEWLRFIAKHSSTGLPIIATKSFIEALSGKVSLSKLNIHDMDSLHPGLGYQLIKRGMDLVIALLLLPVITPTCIILAILIRLDSKGSALFIQERIGQKNKAFKMYKFRSMRVCDDETPRFADMDQHRITRLGAIIRKTRLDELPQFINVLKGDMSLIGPRPEQPGFVEKFEEEVPFYSYRHTVKPGITGWAQVMQGYATCTETTREKVEHDFYYIKHLSLWLDILVIIKTIKTILTGFGAR